MMSSQMGLFNGRFERNGIQCGSSTPETGRDLLVGEFGSVIIVEETLLSSIRAFLWVCSILEISSGAVLFFQPTLIIPFLLLDATSAFIRIFAASLLSIGVVSIMATGIVRSDRYFLIVLLRVIWDILIAVALLIFIIGRLRDGQIVTRFSWIMLIAFVIGFILWMILLVFIAENRRRRRLEKQLRWK